VIWPLVNADMPTSPLATDVRAYPETSQRFLDHEATKSRFLHVRRPTLYVAERQR
jgi:hypothetical protein